MEKLGSAQKIRVIGLNEIQEGLNQADIVISSTGSPNTLISQAMVQQAQKMRCYNPMLIVDIAVPRDVEESAGEVESVYHYTVDDLQNIIQRNLTQREQASAEAEQIIDEENQAFFEWLKIHQFSDLIRRYREEAEQTRQEMLEKALSALQQGESAEQILQELSYKLMNKLIHTPTQAMQAMMKLGNAQGLQAFSKEIQSEEK